MLPHSIIGNFMRRKVKRIEGFAARQSAWMTAICESNRRQFIELYGIPENRIILLPNGVDCGAIPSVANGRRQPMRHLLGVDDRKVAVFVGSGHPPNREAVHFLINEAAPALPNVLFFIIGDTAKTKYDAKKIFEAATQLTTFDAPA